MAAVTLNLGRFAHPFAVCAAVVGSLFRLTLASSMGAFFVVSHRDLRLLDYALVKMITFSRSAIS